MTATIRMNDIQATITDYEWACEDERLEKLLGSTLDPDGPSGADPNPDLHAAQVAIETFGGELVSYDKSEYVEGRIY